LRDVRHPTIDAPLAETLSRVAAVGIEGIDLSACLGPQDGVGWVQASHLVGDGELLERLLLRVGRLLGGPPPLSGETNYFLPEYGEESRLTRLRNSCCLYYRLGDGACFTCPRATDEERARRLSRE